ncbi:MAG: zinc ribbon domain-containing protein [Anaerolineaceae bacterium]|nr:zinc ribbon domain-containing protein [Anaerolineaceae bacterium]
MIDTFSSPLLILTAIVAATIVSVWISLIIWTARDIRIRSKDALTIALSILSIIILSFPGFLIYMILRPKQTIEDAYQHALEEEALLQSIELKERCSNCGKPNNPNWQFCPFCENQLKTKCTICGVLLDDNWKICPVCGPQHSINSVVEDDKDFLPDAKQDEILYDVEDIESETGNPIPEDPETLIEENDFDTL